MIYTIANLVSKILPIGKVAQTAIVVASPRALQAVIAGLGDWYTWQLAIEIYPDSNVSSFAVRNNP